MTTSNIVSRRRLILVGICVSIFSVTLFALAFLNESDYGTGPVVTASAPMGEAREIAFVSNGVGGTVSLIDVSSAKLIRSIDIIPDGAKVGFFRDPKHALFGQRYIEEQAGLNYAQDTDVSPDGTVLYVARGHLADVAAFDVATGDLMWRMPIKGVRADHMKISADGFTLYVSALTANEVTAIDTRSGVAISHFDTGVWPHDIQISQDGAYLYNASIGDLREYSAENQPSPPKAGEPAQYQITKVTTDGLDVVDTFQLPSGVRPFQIDPSGKKIFAQLSNTHSVISYDLDSKAVIKRLDLPVADGVSEEDWDFQAPHHGLDLSPDAKTLCVAGRASDYAGLVNSSDLSLIATVPVGDAPGWSEFDSSGSLCLLANTRSDDVSIISVREHREIARIPVGRAPKHITMANISNETLGLTR